MKRFTPKRWVIFAVLLLLVMAAGGAVWFIFLGGPDPEKPASTPPGEEAVEKTAADPPFKDVVTVEPFERIPLKPGGHMPTVTLAVSLELVQPGMRSEVEAGMASIRTIIETTISETNWLDLRSPEGKLALKLKLIKRINQSLAGQRQAGAQRLDRARIRDLFFINLMMQ